jgi:hypothetical protein
MRMLTRAQIAWAATHDWFVRDMGDGTIMVRDGYTLDGVYHEELVHFRGDLKALRDFANY